MDYVDINISDEEFVTMLKEHIKNEIPLSYTRFGDGEIYFLNQKVPAGILNQLKKTWGYTDINKAKADVLEILHTGLQKTDIIGLMNPDNRNKKLPYSSAWAIKKDYIKTLRDIEGLNAADHMLPRSKLLGDIQNFKEILGGKDLAIISPRSNSLQSNKIHEILNVHVNYIHVPMGMNLQNRDSIFQEMDSIKESVVLFGCSLTGKDFGVYLKDKGKIALDFGATLDAWAGIASRKWFNKNNIQHHCFIGKG